MDAFSVGDKESRLYKELRLKHWKSEPPLLWPSNRRYPNVYNWLRAKLLYARLQVETRHATPLLGRRVCSPAFQTGSQPSHGQGWVRTPQLGRSRAHRCPAASALRRSGSDLLRTGRFLACNRQALQPAEQQVERVPPPRTAFRGPHELSIVRGPPIDASKRRPGLSDS